MQVLVGVVTLVLVAAITPGPNNFVVLRAAARAGLAAALPAIAGIVAGSLALLAVVGAGAGALFAAEPQLRTLVTVAGCAYLAWLGAGLLRSQPAAPAASTPPAGPLALFGFQFLNPKGWVMVLTATSAAPDAPWWHLAAVFAIVPALCLLVWSLLGAGISRLLARPVAAARFDRVMGVLLVTSAIALALGT
ncbi:MAG TPA: LysE family transporter [Kofleriaceae bacterium]|nr:LysE family transporter [Kofleriaceae bacterium]